MVEGEKIKIKSEDHEVEKRQAYVKSWWIWFMKFLFRLIVENITRNCSCFTPAPNFFFFLFVHFFHRLDLMVTLILVPAPLEGYCIVPLVSVSTSPVHQACSIHQTSQPIWWGCICCNPPSVEVYHPWTFTPALPWMSTFIHGPGAFDPSRRGFNFSTNRIDSTDELLIRSIDRITYPTDRDLHVRTTCAINLQCCIIYSARSPRKMYWLWTSRIKQYFAFITGITD